MSTPPPVRVGLGVEVSGGLLPIDVRAAKASLSRAAMTAGTFVKGTWIALAQRMQLSGDYIRGIQERDLRITDRDDHLRVIVEVVNTAESAQWVEEGHGPFHLPSRIDWSRTDGRIKRNPRTGSVWLTIPFRHRAYASPSQQQRQGLSAATVRAMMPAGIYRAARQLEGSQRLNQGPIRGASGQFVASDRYPWGGRLHRTGPQATGGRIRPEEVRPHWSASKFEGMVRFEQLTARGGRQSTYLTFRTITPQSKGWHIPARQGKHLARRVADQMTSGSGKAMLDKLVRDALMSALTG